MKSADAQKQCIGIDLDDVLLDFEKMLCVFHNDRYQTNLTIDDITQWELDVIWNCPGEEAIRRVLEFYHSPEHLEVVPVAGAQTAIEHLSKHYDLKVITSKPEFLREQTEAWITKYFGDSFSEIIFTNHFMGTGKRSKSEVCDELGINIFIDDAPIHIEDLSACGKKVLAFDRPWNQIPLPDTAIRVLGWGEIVQHLLPQ